MTWIALEALSRCAPIDSPSPPGNVLNVAGSPVNGEASSPPPAINDNRPSGDNLDTILFQLRQVTRERDELRKRLALASPGTTFDDCRCKSQPVCQVFVVVAVFFFPFLPCGNN